MGENSSNNSLRTVTGGLRCLQTGSVVTLHHYLAAFSKNQNQTEDIFDTNTLWWCIFSVYRHTPPSLHLIYNRRVCNEDPPPKITLFSRTRWAAPFGSIQHPHVQSWCVAATGLITSKCLELFFISLNNMWTLDAEHVCDGAPCCPERGNAPDSSDKICFRSVTDPLSCGICGEHH